VKKKNLFLGLFVSLLYLGNSLSSDFARASEDDHHLKDEGHTVNLSVSPVGLLFGVATLNADFKVAESLTFGPSALYSSLSAGTVSATSYGFGANLNFYLGHPVFTDSCILNGTVSYVNASNSFGSSSGVSAGANIGYWWFWHGGFNLGLGLGLQYVSLNYASLGLGSISGVMPNGFLNIGYSF